MVGLVGRAHGLRGVAAVGICAGLMGCGGPHGRAPLSPSPQLYWVPHPPSSRGGGPRAWETPTQSRSEVEAPMVALEMSEHDAALRHARAIVRHGHLEIALSAAPIACGHPPAPSAGRLSLMVPPGPGGTFFATTEIGVPASATLQGRSVGLPARDVRVQIEPFALERGARVRGTLRATMPEGSAQGRFDATLCDVEVAGVAGPSPIVPDGPVAGRLAGRPFRTASAVALVVDDAPGKTPRVAAITFFPVPVDCATWRTRARTITTLAIYEIGRAREADRAIGVMQPMLPVLTEVAHGAPAGTGVDHFFGGADPFGQGWIRFDALHLDPGGLVAGVLVAESDLRSPRAEDGLIGDEFRAIVCH